mmetsp:Transcript_2728/g.8012  ORF Transcript_2728/g.8012 Transcript_2728/m.8012 type:complete len:230 (-) Transcript_2728:441-1130(-)
MPQIEVEEYNLPVLHHEIPQLGIPNRYSLGMNVAHGLKQLPPEAPDLVDRNRQQPISAVAVLNGRIDTLRHINRNIGCFEQPSIVMLYRQLSSAILRKVQSAVKERIRRMSDVMQHGRDAGMGRQSLRYPPRPFGCSQLAIADHPLAIVPRYPNDAVWCIATVCAIPARQCRLRLVVHVLVVVVIIKHRNEGIRVLPATQKFANFNMTEPRHVVAVHTIVGSCGRLRHK